MSKRSSRADLILRGARERVRIAEQTERRAKADLDIATAALMAYISTLEALESALATTPRKVREGKSTAPSAGQTIRARNSRLRNHPTASTETSTDDVGSVALCAVPKCGLPEGDVVHRLTDHVFYHLFHAEIKKKGQTVVLPDNPDEFHKTANA